MAWQTFFFVSVLGQGPESYPPLGSFQRQRLYFQTSLSQNPDQITLTFIFLSLWQSVGSRVCRLQYLQLMGSVVAAWDLDLCHSSQLCPRALSLSPGGSFCLALLTIFFTLVLSPSLSRLSFSHTTHPPRSHPRSLLLFPHLSLLLSHLSFFLCPRDCLCLQQLLTPRLRP